MAIFSVFTFFLITSVIPAVLCAVFLGIIIVLEILNFVAWYFKKVIYINDLTTNIEKLII